MIPILLLNVRRFKRESDVVGCNGAARVRVREESRSSKVLRVLGKTPVQFLLIALGLLWLVPTFGLLITSLLSPIDFQVKGWWQVFAQPHKLTWSNYDAIFHNSTIMHSLLTTAEIAVGATVLPIFIGALAGTFAWLDFRPRRFVHPRHRAARSTAADGADRSSASTTPSSTTRQSG